MKLPSNSTIIMDAKELEGLIEETREVLIEFKTVWPFDFFPDTIRLDRNSLVIDHEISWNTHKKISIHYTDLLDAHITKGVLFGSIEIKSKFMTEKEIGISWLWKQDAEHLHRILQGLLIVNKEQIDTKDVPKEDYLALLEKLGDK